MLGNAAKLMVFIHSWNRHAFTLLAKVRANLANISFQKSSSPGLGWAEVIINLLLCFRNALCRQCSTVAARWLPYSFYKWLFNVLLQTKPPLVYVSRSFFCMKMLDFSCHCVQLLAVPLPLSAGPTASYLWPQSSISFDFQPGCPHACACPATAQQVWGLGGQSEAQVQGNSKLPTCMSFGFIYLMFFSALKKIIQTV